MPFASPPSLLCLRSLGGTSVLAGVFSSPVLLRAPKDPINLLLSADTTSVLSRYTGPRTMNLLQIVGPGDIEPNIDIETSPPVYEF